MTTWLAPLKPPQGVAIFDTLHQLGATFQSGLLNAENRTQGTANMRGTLGGHLLEDHEHVARRSL